MTTLRQGPLATANNWHATGLIVRDRLLETLDGALARKVTVISAPAGSGKTSLLRTWSERSRRTRRMALVTVRRDQNDEQLFWIALLHEIQRASGRGDPSAEATTPGFDAEAAVDRVLKEIAEDASEIVMIIDDLHEIGSAAALGNVTRLLTRLPAHAHAVLGTRRDLHIGLHQLRLAGELSEIRAAELQFTPGETLEMLESSGISLPEAAAATLQRRTEGWAAGLRLAAISLAGHPDPERFVAEFSGSHRTVADYLIPEMLESQPSKCNGYSCALRYCTESMANWPT